LVVGNGEPAIEPFVEGRQGLCWGTAILAEDDWSDGVVGREDGDIAGISNLGNEEVARVGGASEFRNGAIERDSVPDLDFAQHGCQGRVDVDSVGDTDIIRLLSDEVETSGSLLVSRVSHKTWHNEDERYLCCNNTGNVLDCLSFEGTKEGRALDIDDTRRGDRSRQRRRPEKPVIESRHGGFNKCLSLTRIGIKPVDNLWGITEIIKSSGRFV